MEFTTRFELQSQATRLVEGACYGTSIPRQERESHPLSCPFPRDLARDDGRCYLFRPQFGARHPKIRVAQIHTVSYPRFSRPY